MWWWQKLVSAQHLAGSNHIQIFICWLIQQALKISQPSTPTTPKKWYARKYGFTGCHPFRDSFLPIWLNVRTYGTWMDGEYVRRMRKRKSAQWKHQEHQEAFVTGTMIEEDWGLNLRDIKSNATTTAVRIYNNFQNRAPTMLAVILLIAVLVACASAFKVVAPSRVASGTQLPSYIIWLLKDKNCCNNRRLSSANSWQKLMFILLN